MLWLEAQRAEKYERTYCARERIATMVSRMNWRKISLIVPGGAYTPGGGSLASRESSGEAGRDETKAEGISVRRGIRTGADIP